VCPTTQLAIDTFVVLWQVESQAIEMKAVVTQISGIIKKWAAMH